MELWGIGAVFTKPFLSPNHTPFYRPFSRQTWVSQLPPWLLWQAGEVAIRFYSLYPPTAFQLPWPRGFGAKFLRARSPSCHPTNSVIALKGNCHQISSFKTLIDGFMCKRVALYLQLMTCMIVAYFAWEWPLLYNLNMKSNLAVHSWSACRPYSRFIIILFVDLIRQNQMQMSCRFSVFWQLVGAELSQGLDVVQQCSVYPEFNSAGRGKWGNQGDTYKIYLLTRFFSSEVHNIRPGGLSCCPWPTKEKWRKYGLLAYSADAVSAVALSWAAVASKLRWSVAETVAHYWNDSVICSSVL